VSQIENWKGIKKKRVKERQEEVLGRGGERI
jgi:hypothetical protein